MVMTIIGTTHPPPEYGSVEWGQEPVSGIDLMDKYYLFPPVHGTIMG